MGCGASSAEQLKQHNSERIDAELEKDRENNDLLWASCDAVIVKQLPCRVDDRYPQEEKQRAFVLAPTPPR